MGFELPETVSNQLQQLVDKMCSGGYIAADEPPEIPTVPSKPRGIVYGPPRFIPAARRCRRLLVEALGGNDLE